MPEQPDSPYETRVESMRKIFRQAMRGRPAEGEDPTVAEMKANRRVSMRKRGNAMGGASLGSGSLTFATGRPRDPLFYWKQNNLPYELTRQDELIRLRAYCRLLYASHPLIASCVDIYTKYPLLGMELRCKDQKISDFYSELFLDEDRLNYPEFLLRLGREYWVCGEAWPFATFNEPLGVWEAEELLNPDDVEVQSSPFLRDPRYMIRLPEALREVIVRRQPVWEYEQLMQAYPELKNYADNDSKMPVSNILLRQMKFETDTFNPRGVPILMRAMRAIMQEEMLNSAQDSIADRLYTPLILVKLGASAKDLGTDTPWIPTQDDLENFENDFDAAMAADFRVLTHQIGIDIDDVFGRESMPDLSGDFDRLEARMLLAFGLSATMLTGGSEGETYAADALNRDLISQLLTTYQNLIKRHYRQRALIVAEAQEHYDYEERGGKRYVTYEEILEVDPDTGQESIIRQPKLLVPDMHMATMSLKDDEAQRQFLEALRESGAPISMRTRYTNLPIDFEEEMERTSEEQVMMAVAEQETRKKTYLALRNKGLPIPQDLRTDFGPMAAQLNIPSATEGMRTPVLGLDPTGAYPNLAPTPEDLQMDPTAGGVLPPGAPAAPPVDPADGSSEDDGQDRPEESDEQRGGMPKDAALYRNAHHMRRIADIHRPTATEVARASRWEPPRHIGLRRHALSDIDYEIPLPQDDPAPSAAYDERHGAYGNTPQNPQRRPMTAADHDDDDDEDACCYCDNTGHDSAEHRCSDCNEPGHEAQWGTCHYISHYTRDLPQLHAETGGLHRGFGLDLNPADHRFVHDEHAPAAQRAMRLMDRVREGGEYGRYWTGDHPDADALKAATRFADVGQNEDRNTHVVLHAAKPGFEHVIHGPQQTKHHNVWRWNTETPEIGLYPGTPVHVTGISWKARDSQTWTRHDFNTPLPPHPAP